MSVTFKDAEITPGKAPAIVSRVYVSGRLSGYIKPDCSAFYHQPKSSPACRGESFSSVRAVKESLRG